MTGMGEGNTDIRRGPDTIGVGGPEDTSGSRPEDLFFNPYIDVIFPKSDDGGENAFSAEGFKTVFDKLNARIVGVGEEGKMREILLKMMQNKLLTIAGQNSEALRDQAQEMVDAFDAWRGDLASYGKRLSGITREIFQLSRLNPFTTGGSFSVMDTLDYPDMDRALDKLDEERRSTSRKVK